jgi:hypothetical protein
MLFAYDQTLSPFAEADVLRTSLNAKGRPSMVMAYRPKAAFGIVI